MPQRSWVRRPTRRTTAIVGAVTAIAIAVPAYADKHPDHGKHKGQQSTAPSAQFTPGMRLKDDAGESTGAAEPSIEVDSAGTPYVTGPNGVPTGGCPFWTIDPNASGLGYTFDGRFDTDKNGIGGGDCDVTSTGPGQIGVSSLSLANLTTNTSTDGGKTWRDQANPFGQQVFGTDRQWQAVDNGLGVTYLTVHDLYTSDIQVATSYDGGYTYLQNNPAITPDTMAAAADANHFSPTVIGPDHKLYIAFVAPANAAENAQVQVTGNAGLSNWNEHVVYLAVGDPCAVTCAEGQVGPIAWSNYVVYTGPNGQDYGHDFPAIAVDSNKDASGASTVYVGWAGDTASTSTNQINVATVKVTDDGVAAGAPVAVSAPLNAHSNMFPWLEAGDGGRADVVWYYGAPISTSDGKCPPGVTGVKNDNNGVANNCFQDWYVGFSQTLDSGSTWSTPVAASPVVHHGSVCDQGLNCNLNGGDRTLLDFFDMAIDPNGAANIAYAEDIDSPGNATIVYARQCAGSSTSTATPTVSYSCTPGWTDPYLGTPPPPGPPYNETQSYFGVPGDVTTGCLGGTVSVNVGGACFDQFPTGGTLNVTIADATGQMVAAWVSYQNGAGDDMDVLVDVCGSGSVSVPVGAATMFVQTLQALSQDSTGPIPATSCTGAVPATAGTITVSE